LTRAEFSENPGFAGVFAQKKTLNKGLTMGQEGVDLVRSLSLNLNLQRK